MIFFFVTCLGWCHTADGSEIPRFHQLRLVQGGPPPVINGAP